MTEQSHRSENDVIGRGATCKRALFTILFAMIDRVALSVLAVVILFELCFTLVTKRVAGPRS